MASPSHPFRLVGAVLLGWVMLPVTFLGVVGTITDHGPMRPFWAMAAVAGIGGIVSAAMTAREVIRAGREEAARERSARTGQSGGLVVARWKVDRSAALRFAEAEWRSRRLEVVGIAVGAFVLGGAFLWWTQDDFSGGFQASTFLAVLVLVIGLGKYYVEYQKAVNGGEDVLVFPDSVVVLGSWHALGGQRRLTAVAFEGGVLSFDVAWVTSKGATARDTIRVPVPDEARGQAEEAVEFFRERVAQ